MHILDAILALPGGPWLLLGSLLTGGLLAVPWRPEDAHAMHDALDRLIRDVFSALRRSPDAPPPPEPHPAVRLGAPSCRHQATSGRTAPALLSFRTHRASAARSTPSVTAARRVDRRESPRFRPLSPLGHGMSNTLSDVA